MNNISKTLQEKVDAKLRQMQRDPLKGTVFSEDAAGNKTFTEPTNQTVLDLTDTPASYTGEAGKALIVKLAEDGIEFGEAGMTLPEPLGEIDTATHKGIGVFTDWPTNDFGSMVALIGKKDTKNSVYLEDSQADFEPGELEDVEATAAGLELAGGIKWYDEGVEGVDWVVGYSKGTGTQSKESDHLYFSLVSGVDNQRIYETNETIDITDIDTLVIDWECSTAEKSFSMVRFGITSNKGTDRTDYEEFITRRGGDSSAPFARTEDTLDVSGYSGSYYVKVAAREGELEAKVYGVYEEGAAGFPPHGNRIALPQDLTTLSTDPGLEIRWTSTEPAGTTVTIETAAKGETAYTDENIGTGNNVSTATTDNHSTDNLSSNSYTAVTQHIEALEDGRVIKVHYRSRSTGSHTVSFRDWDDNELANASGSGVAAGDWYEFTLNTAVDIETGTQYKIHIARPSTTLYFAASHYSGTLWKAVGWSLGGTGTMAMGLETEDVLQDTFYLPAYPAERHDDLVIKVDAVATTNFTRPGQEFTLYLGGATGGTFTLGDGTTNTSALNYNDSAATIETALEAIYGSGKVTVTAGTDFTVAFDAGVRVSDLEADFTNLTGATDPALTATETNYYPKKIVFDSGSEPGNTLAVTATYTGVTNPSETAEVQTLYLGGATGGTFTLSDGTTTTAAIAYDASATDIGGELEAIFGTGLVTVAAATDFTITFSVRVRASGLTADFTSLTGATSPTLTETTAYSAGDWEEQTTATAISNIPAGDLTGQHLWIRQNLATDDVSETPILTLAEVYYGTEEYNVFTTAGTVGTL